jgi:CrcB protein
MINYLWVGLGGAFGSVARVWMAELIARYCGSWLPFGTLLVNITGSFLIGFLATGVGPEGRWMASAYGRSFLMAGICGGYTTFSSFSLQTLVLAREGSWMRAGLNVILSFALCLIAVWCGHMAGATLQAAKAN